MSADEGDASCVDYLLANPFSTLAHEEKKKIVLAGRPCPALASLQVVHTEKNRNYVRRFKEALYARVPWLTGSDERQRLLCWPCVLFNDEKNVWNGDGYENLNNLSSAIQKHERSQQHAACALALRMFAAVRADRRAAATLANLVVAHNARVVKHREMLCRMIDVLCFLVTLEESDDEDSGAFSRNYLETLRLIGEFHPMLKGHLESSVVFRRTPLNDLIRAVESVLVATIRKELDETPYIAVVLEDSRDVTGASRLAVVLRYVTESGETRERFLRFVDGAEKSPEEHIVDVVTEFSLQDKLVAYVYGGAGAGQIGEDTGVREVCPLAIFMHNQRRGLNAVIVQSAGAIKECRVFFGTLNRLAEFISSSPKRSRRLADFMERRLLTVSTARWMSSTRRQIDTVSRHRMDLVEYLEDAVDDEASEWGGEATVLARGFIAALTTLEFCFQQVLWAQVLSRISALNAALRADDGDVAERIKYTKDILLVDRFEGYDRVWRKVLKENTGSELAPRKKTSRKNDLKENYHRLYCEIINNVTSQLDHRLTSMEHTEFIGLLESADFQLYLNCISEEMFFNLRETYGKMFDFPRLKNELFVVYKNEDFRGKTVEELAAYMYDYGVDEVLTEVYRLCLLILTLPTSVVGASASASASRRIRGHARAKRRDDKLSLLAVEKTLLIELQKTRTWYEDVVTVFTQQETREDFTFQ